MGARIYRRPEKASSNRPTEISLTGAATLAAALAILSDGALAQDVPLPQINVTDTRLTGIGSPGRGGSAAPALRGTSSGTAPADSIGNANVPDNGGGITGASTTIITRQDIERAPEATIADILSREAGIQTSNFYGGVNGVGTTVDMRGFGVTGASNTLILINGRRLNDWDLPGFDLTTLGKNSVERIEITRGNSGAVLYGDGAVGGVINIVTRNGVGQPSQARIEAATVRMRRARAMSRRTCRRARSRPRSTANGLNSTGYRWNNSLHQQQRRRRSAIGRPSKGSVYLQYRRRRSEDDGCPGSAASTSHAGQGRVQSRSPRHQHAAGLWRTSRASALPAASPQCWRRASK